VEEAAAQIERAAAAKECRPCGCFHDALRTLGGGLPAAGRLARLAAAIGEGKGVLAVRTYDCLGCEVCYPALAMSALEGAGAKFDIRPCPDEVVEPRAGWPPLAGDYTVLRYRAPVAVCTLNHGELVGPIASSREAAISIVGTLRTENLGIERVITNVVANPNIRFLVLCGADSRQAIGHLPGRSLLSLSRAGIDEWGRIIGAAGKRPILRNVGGEAVERFRRSVEIADLIGVDDVNAILCLVRACAARDPGPAGPVSTSVRELRTVAGYLPRRTVGDPAGYFVLYVDRVRGLLSLEHFGSDGTLDTVLEGRSAAELYTPAIERRLVSRLDHAAYLGRELARAEAALASGAQYVQDGAPERRPAGRGSTSCSRGVARSGDGPRGGAAR
jgi:tetrahydromethanopterin S-methyltransferase subunit A